MAQEQKKVVKSPLTEVFRKSWRQVLQATFLVAVTYTLFYTLATWSLAWGTKSSADGGGDLGFSNQQYLLMLMAAVCVFALFIVLSCVYADRIGRRRVIVFSSCALVVFAFAFPFLLDGGLVGQRNFVATMAFLCVGFMLMGIAFGPIGAFLPELFEANVRYSGSGIGYNLAAIVGAALVPTIATWLSANWGVHSVGLYLAVMAVCCLIAVLSCKGDQGRRFHQVIPAVDRHPSRGSDSVRVPPGGWRTLRQPPVCSSGVGHWRAAAHRGA